LQEIGGISIHDMFEHGMSLMVEDNADGEAWWCFEERECHCGNDCLSCSIYK
jgi:hypothetical protein